MKPRPNIDNHLPSGIENMHTRLIDMLKEQNDWAKEAEQEIKDGQAREKKLKAMSADRQAENDKDCKYHLEVENQLQDEIAEKDQLIKDVYENYSTMDFKLKLRFDKMLGI